MKTFRELREEAQPVEKPKKEVSAANVPAEKGTEGHVVPPKQGRPQTNTYVCY